MRYVILLASVLIQLCIGGLYAWSTFVPALRDSYGLSTAQTQLVFGGLIAVFTLSMVYAGKLLHWRGPTQVAGTGAVLFGVGYLTASLSGGTLPMMLLGVSGFAGIGTAFCYVCALAMCVRWFPARKGLATGVAVAGFGGGAILLSSLAKRLFLQGVDVLAIFRWVGVSYGCVMIGSALLLRWPSAYEGTHIRPAPPLRGLLRDRFFWVLVIGMFCGTFAGLLVIGNLGPMALTSGLSSSVAVGAVSAFAVGNTAGRIAWGWIADKIRVRVIPLSLAALAVATCGLVPWSTKATVFITLSMFVGFGFGACFVIYATMTASHYGPDRVGSVYPLVFLAYGVAGIGGPWIGGWLYDTTASYELACLASVVVVLTGLLASSRLLWSSTQTVSSALAGEDGKFAKKEVA